MNEEGTTKGCSATAAAEAVLRAHDFLLDEGEWLPWLVVDGPTAGSSSLAQPIEETREMAAEASLAAELDAVRRLIYRNKSQHRGSRFFGQLQEVSRRGKELLECMKSLGEVSPIVRIADAAKAVLLHLRAYTTCAALAGACEVCFLSASQQIAQTYFMSFNVVTLSCISRISSAFRAISSSLSDNYWKVVEALRPRAVPEVGELLNQPLSEVADRLLQASVSRGPRLVGSISREQYQRRAMSPFPLKKDETGKSISERPVSKATESPPEKSKVGKRRQTAAENAPSVLKDGAQGRRRRRIVGHFHPLGRGMRFALLKSHKRIGKQKAMVKE